MSSVLSSAVPENAAIQIPRPGWPKWLREPLLHFVVLGAVLFGIDHLVSTRNGDPRTISVNEAVDAEARSVFHKARDREPTEDELYALRRVWLDNEVLYREGLALGVDKGDASIRERVIFKMLSIVDADLKRPALDDKVLRDWFEENRSRYDEPARYDFQEAVLAGERSEVNVRALVDTLQKGAGGDLNAGLRVFKARPHANIVDAYGAEFAAALEDSAPGKWQALATRSGWRAVQLSALIPPRPAAFEAVRGVVLQDWTDAVMAEQRTAAVRALASKYKVHYEDAR